jgi:hypothetical protein
VCRNLLYLVSFRVNVSGLRCALRVGANRNNSPDTVFHLGVDKCPGDDGGSFMIYQNKWGVLENTCGSCECCHTGLPDVPAGNVDTTQKSHNCQHDMPGQYGESMKTQDKSELIPVILFSSPPIFLYLCAYDSTKALMAARWATFVKAVPQDIMNSPFTV